MNKKTRALTLSALFTALCVISLYSASVSPTGQLGFAAFASLFVAGAVIESGLSYGIYVYVAGSALSMLLFPGRTAPLLFILFFGYYPVIKSLIERIKLISVQWALKLLVFNVSLTVIYFILKVLMFDITDSTISVVVLYIGGSALFALFDYGYTKVIRFYSARIRGRGVRR